MGRMGVSTRLGRCLRTCHLTCLPLPSAKVTTQSDAEAPQRQLDCDYCATTWRSDGSRRGKDVGARDRTGKGRVWRPRFSLGSLRLLCLVPVCVCVEWLCLRLLLEQEEIGDGVRTHGRVDIFACFVLLIDSRLLFVCCVCLVLLSF